MNKKAIGWLLMLWGLGLIAGSVAQAQQVPGDMVLFNGKIVTVDDHSFSSQLGTIAQAMHVQDGKILHIGNNAQIRAMAGPNTKVIDLKGRTVIPGFILTHEHPWDWNAVTPLLVKKVLTDDIVVVRTMDGSPEENLRAFPAALTEAVSKAKPGQWIYFIFTLGKKYEYGARGNVRWGRAFLDPKVFDVLDGKRITKEQLDKAAPNNPVLLRDVFVGTLTNQKAIDESLKVFPDPGMNPYAPTPPGVEYAGSPARSPMRWMLQSVILRDHYPQLVEIMRLGNEWWAGYGMTTYGSNAYDPANLKVYRDLDHKGQMPIRNMWTWNWRPEYMYTDPFFMTDITSRVGEGTDYLWFGGGIVSTGMECTTAEPLPSSKLAKIADLQIDAARRSCNFAPGTYASKLMYQYIKAGGRFVNMHTAGDEDIDNMMKIIVQASKDAGMTDEEIRAKRHGFDHSPMWPRPDQVPMFKRYGFLADGNAFEIYQDAPATFEIFGETASGWVVPKKRLVEAQIYNTFEMDRALLTTDLTVFNGLSWMMNRKGWDGKVYAQDQAVDRQTALKIATIWGAYYVLREKVLGSLEQGKWADFAVLDRDYLTVPEDDIANTRVLMTVVGGKVVHLVPSLAKEIGLQPTGAMVQLGPAAQY